MKNQFSCSAVLFLALLTSPELATLARGRSAVSVSLREGATEQFKTALHYDTSIESLPLEHQRLVKDVLVKGATEWLSNVLKVRPLREKIMFERSCADNLYYYIRDSQRYCRGNCEPVVMCGPVKVPAGHLKGCRSCRADGSSCETGEAGEGVGKGKHFLLYVSAINNRNCNSPRRPLADSAHCLQEDDFDRPTAAYLNFCPRALSSDSAHITPQLQLVLKELIHSLAFSEQLYPFYHNEQGYPRTPRSPSGKPVQHLDGSYSVDPNTLVHRTVYWTTHVSKVPHSVSMIVSPNVLREVRDHFNCPTMRGAELENQGGVGVAMNNWEKRIFGNELMTASLSSQPVVSRITLALLEDSGWYLPDYHFAGDLLWGRLAGCAFVNDSCAGWMDWTEDYSRIRTDPFCDGLDYRKGRLGCVDARTAVGPCFAKNYSTDLPKDYQYLSRKRGGSLSLYDYCPVYSAVEYGTIRVGRSCLNPNHAPSSNASVSLETFGSDSRCFEQFEPFVRTDTNGTEVRGDTYGAGCYEFRCSARRIFIKVGKEEYRCGGKGQKKSVVVEQDGMTYRGKFICPAYEEVCAAYDCINMCSHHGTCVYGVCYCHPGFYGDDCSRSYAQNLLSCSDVECQNEAKCSNATSDGHGFVCECTLGRAGTFCERRIIKDPCVGETCSGNGFCSPSRGGKVAKCNCNLGWKGSSCHRLVDFCEEAGTPCGDHGQCVANTTTCRCEPNRTGKQCEITIDFCEPANPCKNGGTCQNDFENQAFTCHCPSSYEGDYCQYPYFDPCTLDPCQNGGNCTRRNSSSFACKCPVGWIGSICNQEDRCLVNPCSNGGTCVNIEQSSVCICARGYTGERCRHLVDPCLDNPCQHGGTCRQVINAPRGTIECECLSNFYGEYCDIPQIHHIQPVN